jgi:hypothetical protein
MHYLISNTEQVLKLRQPMAKSSAEVISIPSGASINEAIVEWTKENDVCSCSLFWKKKLPFVAGIAVWCHLSLFELFLILAPK